MESLLNMVESLPIWVKILIPFVGSFVYPVTYVLIKCGLSHIKVVDGIKISIKIVLYSIKIVLYSIPLFIIIIIILGITQLVLNIWDIDIWPFIIKHIWMLFYIFLILVHVYVTITPNKPRGSSHSHRTSLPTSKNRSNKSLPATKNSVKTVVVPVNPKKDGIANNPFAPSNMTNIENKLSDGISVKLDFNETYTKIDKSLRIIKSSGAKITFCNINPKKSATLDNMRRIAAQAPGLIIYDVVIDAGFEAMKLAESGACFVCDCSNGSTIIPDIAKAAKDGKGHVTFINCNGLQSYRLKQIRELGGAYVEFQ